MSTDHEANNKTAFARFHDACNSGDLALISTTIDETFHPDALFHTPAPIKESGPEAMKRVWTLLLRAFPDIHVTVEDVISECDKVVFRNTVTGTHRGEYRGLRPTGKSLTYNEIFIIRFADGRIAEVWGVVDTLSQLEQLGTVRVD
jgi:steroid delta-isomerase-like uncharacterized protein